MKIFVLIFCLLFLNKVVLLSHDQELQPVHQRIVVEAYKLLKLQLSKEDIGFADMDNYIGVADEYETYYWNNVNTVADGGKND